MEKEFYRRHLPHLQPLGGTFFVTYNLHGSIPEEKWKEWAIAFEKDVELLEEKKEATSENLDALAKRHFAQKDAFFDSCKEGNHYLKIDAIAQIVANSWHFWNNQRLELLAYCIMSNHVHVVFRLFGQDEIENPYYLVDIMHSVKRFSAKECNKALNLSGQFWHHESYDRLVRNKEELKRILFYVLNNPVKAGLCEHIADWKWSYIKTEYNDFY